MFFNPDTVFRMAILLLIRRLSMGMQMYRIFVKLPIVEGFLQQRTDANN